MRVWAWRLCKGLLSLMLLALAVIASWSPGAAMRTDGWLMGAFFLLLAVLPWIAWKRLEPALPLLGAGGGIALLLGAPQLAAQSAGSSSCKALCGLSLLVASIGGTMLAALPYALLGAVAIFYSVRTLLRRYRASAF